MRTTQEIISAMVAEYETFEKSMADRKRQADEELEREKLVKFDQAINVLVAIGALTPEEIDALFADSGVEIESAGKETEEITLRSVTIKDLYVRVYPRIPGAPTARITFLSKRTNVGYDLFSHDHRVLALVVVAAAVEASKDEKERREIYGVGLDPKS